MVKALLGDEDGKVSLVIVRGSVRGCPWIMPVHSR